jgi:hypothetical protein
LPIRRELRHEDPSFEERVRKLLDQALQWRPATLLDYLLVVAVLGILIALALIVGLELHLLHRLT